VASAKVVGRGVGVGLGTNVDSTVGVVVEVANFVGVLSFEGVG
jgi:hypothetical protein